MLTPDFDAGARDAEPEMPRGGKGGDVRLVWKKRIMLSQVRRQVALAQPKVGWFVMFV